MLTWNEERSIGATLEALARQDTLDFEVLVVDAASTDGTQSIVRAAQRTFPVALRLEALPARAPIGEARNRGAHLAAAPAVAYLSADAEPDPSWVTEAVRSLESADLVFGFQAHAPRRWSTAAAVRGLRYHFPDRETADPFPFASNVAAAYRRDVLLRCPFDPWANAAEDLRLARRAAALGHRAAYNPRMRVRHRDVASAREEMRKNWREGAGWGLYVQDLGVLWPVLAWGGLLALALAAFLLGPAAGALALAVALWLPAVRRAVRNRPRMPPTALLRGIAASPPFDLAFLVQYLRGLAGRGQARRGDPA